MTRALCPRSAAFLLSLVTAACLPQDARHKDTVPRDTDSESDVDTDSDTDADSDVDTDSDTDTGSVDADGDGWTVADGDCDDDDEAVNPGATEVCNSVDDDCDGGVDVGAVDATTWCQDADGDSYGSVEKQTESCTQPEGWTSDCSDCDDAHASAYPGGSEYVRDGIDSNCNGWTDERIVPDDFATIQAGLDGTLPGDVVLVRAGTYREALVVPNRALHLVGEDGAEATFVDARGLSGSALAFEDSAAEVEVEGLWLRNATADSNVYCQDVYGLFHLHDAIITGGTKGYSAMAISRCVATIERVVVADNGPGTGGATVTLVGRATDITLRNVLVVDNSDGIAVAAQADDGAAVSLEHLTVVGNRGAGVNLYPLDGTLSLTDSIVSGNTCVGYGCGVTGWGSPLIAYTDIWGNTDQYGSTDNTNGISFTPGSNGNMSADPQFVSWSPSTNWSTWDLHLQSTSPCADAGDPTTLDADGTRADMGYYGGPAAP